MTTEPTLADDEMQLARIAADLEAALVRSVPKWLARVATSVAPDLDPARLADAVAATMVEFEPRVARVLHADVDAGAGNPLAVVRATTATITALLLESGATPPPRDDFDVRAFPDDVFALGPAAFVDIDESLHEPGLVWGAARAHVHLRRRREADE